MNILHSLEYRDPLFGIIFLMFCFGLVIIGMYCWNYLSDKRRHDSFIKFMENFDYIGFDKEAKEFLALSPNPMPSILFMAKMYQQSGDYEKAIRLYTTLLDYLKSPTDKIPILESLGKAYYKAGFIQRAKKIFLEILHHFPHSKETLEQLIKVQEELGQYQDALASANCLEELSGNEQLQILYLKAKILINHSKLSKQKPSKMLELLKKETRLKRIILEFLRDFHPTFFWEAIESLDNHDILGVIDILWNLSQNQLPALPSRLKIVNEIFQAKGYYHPTDEKKETFELEALYLLRQSNHYEGDLSFHYRCNTCKGTSPLSFERCPHCGELLNVQILPSIKAKQNEVRYSFL